jgi:hypothetical protein
LTGRRGRRRNQLLDDLKERMEYSKFKEETADRTRFGRGCAADVREKTVLGLCSRNTPFLVRCDLTDLHT